MLTTLLFAFLFGVVMVLSPCVLPVLPFLLTGAIGGRARPYSIITGFVASFTAFTLSLSGFVAVLGISGDAQRLISAGLLLAFGLRLLIPALHAAFERVSARAIGSVTSTLSHSLLAAACGAVWRSVACLACCVSPCVGPIISSVITLALSNAVTLQVFFATLAFSIGTAIPMLAIMVGGRKLLNRVPWLLGNLNRIQRGFGVVLIVFAVGIGFNLDRRFQTWVLDSFPAYAAAITSLEDQAPAGTTLEPLRLISVAVNAEGENTVLPFFRSFAK